MFEVDDKDYVQLRECPFGCRWTDSVRAPISDDELSQIRPLSFQKSQAAWDYAEAFQGENYWERFQEIDQFTADGRGDEGHDNVIRAWLTKCLSSEPIPLFVSWTEQQAVETNALVFIKYWDTFCYPVEDLVIWPKHERWVLLFDYKQNFYFAQARAASSNGHRL